ncbi:MAG: RNA methyltransferase [Chlamydiota bacterium]
MLKIVSLRNPKIKQAVKLRGKRERDRTRSFLIEGYRELSRAVKGGVSLVSLFYSPDHFLGSHESALIREIREQGVEAFEVHQRVFEKISYRDRPDGLLAVAMQTRLTLRQLDRKISHQRSPFLVVAEAIEKPGNLGSILRSADATGVDALLVCDRCTDIYNPNVIRASVGTLFTVPVLEVTSEEAIEWLKKWRIEIVATSPDADETFTAADLAGPIALAIGTEQLGLSEKWIEASDLQVRIPMHGIADSLNVAAATTLLLYEIRRQRP